MKKLLLVLLLQNLSYAGISEFLFTPKLKEELKEQVAEMDVKFDIKLADLELASGVGISSKYRYEVEQSDISSLEARIDKWIVQMDLRPGDIIKDQLNLPIFINIKKGAEIHFVRQFRSKKEALKAIPYTLAKLPINSERALRLNPGDFVSIPTSLSIISGLSSSALSGYVHSNASVYASFSGDYLVHIFKMKDQKVRMKVIAQRKNDYGANGGVKFDYDIFGVSILDKQIERFFDFNLVDLGASKGEGHQLLVDYVFDLSDADARAAYDNILGSTFKFKDLELFKEFIKERGIENRVFSSYELADDLAQADKDKNVKRVERIFKGLNDFDREALKLKTSLILAKFSRNWNYVENNISYDDIEGLRHSFYYPTFTFSKEQKVGFGHFSLKEKVDQTWFGLVPNKIDDQTWGEFSDFGINYVRKDQVFRHDEQAKFSQLLVDTLPKEIYEQIDFGAWENLNDKKRVNIHFQVVLKSEALNTLKGLSVKEIQTSLYEFYRDRKLIDLVYIDGFFRRLWKKITLIQKDERADIKTISQTLFDIVNNDKMSGKDKLQKLFSLRERAVFKKAGLKFLISHLSAEEKANYVYVNLNLSDKESEEVHFLYGDRRDEDLYKQLDYINKVLNDRSYDLRITKDQLDFLE